MHFPVNQGRGLNEKQYECLNKMRKPQLRERIPMEIVAGRRGNLFFVEARMEFEEEARTLGLDLRSPAVSQGTSSCLVRPPPRNQ